MKYVWIAYTVGQDGVTAQVQATSLKRQDLEDLIGVYIEGPVPAEMYPVGRIFQLN